MPINIKILHLILNQNRFTMFIRMMATIRWSQYDSWQTMVIHGRYITILLIMVVGWWQLYSMTIDGLSVPNCLIKQMEFTNLNFKNLIFNVKFIIGCLY